MFDSFFHGIPRRRYRMLEPSQNARLKELADLIEKERDHDKFTKLIAARLV